MILATELGLFQERTQMEFVENAIGRRVPTSVNGQPKKPFRQAYDPEYGPPWAGRPG